jgi:hypothetical protein
MEEENTNDYSDGPVRQDNDNQIEDGDMVEANYAESSPGIGNETYNRGSVYLDEPQAVGNSRSNHEIKIAQLNSGYLVNVGCQSAAVETTEALLKVLGEYLDDPSGFENKWYKNPNRNKLS